MARFSQGSGSSNNGGAALNYVQVNGGTQQTISSAPSSIIDLTIITTGKPVQISVTGEGANANAGSWLRLNLFRDDVEIGNAIQMESSAASENVPFAINFIDDVAAGTYNYSARVTTLAGGNWTFGEVAGPVMNAVELTGFKGDRGPRGFTGPQGEPGTGGTGSANIPVVASFLTYEEGRDALPVINENFGWDDNGLWFGPTAADSESNVSYPVFTNFTIPQNTPVHVEFDMVVDAFCSDIGMAIYVDGVTPNWTWGTDSSRIAAQFNCPSIELNGLSVQGTVDEQDLMIAGPGTYRFVFDYNPTIESDQVTFAYSLAGNVLAQTSINEVLPTGDYRIGFASDNDGPDDEDPNVNPRSYIKNLVIKTNPQTANETIYASTLMPGSTADFVFTNNVMSMANNDESMILKTFDGVGVQNGEIKLDPNNSIARMKIGNDENQYFDASWPSWSLATWTSNGLDSNLTLANAPDVYSFLNSNTMNYASNITISVNGGNRATYNGWSGGPSEFTLFLGGVNNDNSDVVNNVQFFYDVTSQLLFDYDEGEAILESQDLNLYIRTTGSRDISLNAGDDIDLTAGDEVRFYSNNNNNSGPSSYQWRMNSEGGFEFPGSGYIENPVASSGDGQSLDTFKIVPDGTSVGNGSDQYLIIDPTAPNHIHIRAGGTQDYSTADLILGGELNHVQISDLDKTVGVRTRVPDLTNSYVNDNTVSNSYMIVANDAITGPNGVVNVDGLDYAVMTEEYDQPMPGLKTISISGGNFTAGNNYTFRVAGGENNWTFASSGTLYGPAQGGVAFNSITNDPDFDLGISSDRTIILSGTNGEFLNDQNVPGNQIATIGDISNLASGEVSFTVNGGSLGTMPTFDGAPLFSGSYVKTGPMVHFQIQVDMDNITSFGTGQYYVDLPFDAKYGYQLKEGCLHDISTSNQFAIGGHVAAGTSRLYLTYTGSNGQDEMFTHNSPVGLNAGDNFHISGTYITN